MLAVCTKGMCVCVFVIVNETVRLRSSSKKQSIIYCLSLFIIVLKKNHPKTISSLTSPDFVLKEQKKHFLNILKSLKCKPDLNAVLLFLGYVEIHLNDLTNAGLFSTQAVSSSYTEPHLDKGAAQYKCRLYAGEKPDHVEQLRVKCLAEGHTNSSFNGRGDHV